MDAKKLEPLREMAKKWPHVGATLANGFCDARRESCYPCRILAWCDTAEAWLKEQYPYATKTRRVLLGEKK